MIESLNAVLVECVKACGGSHMVGAKLWPEKTPEAAQRALLDCLNEDRPAKLSPEQVLFILRLSRAKSFHDGINFICADLGYADPTPIDPKDEVAELLRINNELRSKLLQSSERIERLLAPRATVRSAA
jgi:hypothetical protein